jgi:hypothetical protein
MYLGAAALLMPLVFASALVVLLRRLAGRSGPLLRIEYVNNQPTGGYPGMVLGTLPPGFGVPQGAAATPTSPLPDVALAPEGESTAEQFEIGPSFAEERQQRQAQAGQQEEGVLRQLFEENLKLQRGVQERQAAAA